MNQKFKAAILDNLEAYGGYDNAAAACSTLADEFAVGFADFRQIKCARYGKEWLYMGNLYTTLQLLELYKSQNHGK